MCGESCELPEQQVKTVVMISRSSQCDLRSDRFGACCSSITLLSLCKVCDGGSDVGSSDADRGTTLQSDSFEETSEASVANNEGDCNSNNGGFQQPGGALEIVFQMGACSHGVLQ